MTIQSLACLTSNGSNECWLDERSRCTHSWLLFWKDNRLHIVSPLVSISGLSNPACRQIHTWSKILHLSDWFMWFVRELWFIKVSAWWNVYLGTEGVVCYTDCKDLRSKCVICDFWLDLNQYHVIGPSEYSTKTAQMLHVFWSTAPLLCAKCKR